MYRTSVRLTHHAAFGGLDISCLYPTDLDSSYLVFTVPDIPSTPVSGFLAGKEKGDSGFSMWMANQKWALLDGFHHIFTQRFPQGC